MSWLDTLEEIRKKDWTSASEDERARASKDVILMASSASAAGSMVPVPFVDLAILIPIHTAMVMTIGHIHGRPITKTEAKRVVVELGAVAGLSLAGRAAVSALKKLVMPAVGGVVAAPMTFAITFGLGRVTVAYFHNPHLSRDQLSKIFEDAVKEGKAAFSMEALERFRAKEESADAEDDGEAPPPPEAKKEEPRDPVDAEERRQASESLRPKKRSM
jgi:uncharacterized protein (DUF697 family)